MSRTQTIFFISALVFVGTSINAGKKAFEGRAVYHSQCSINPNPVQYQGHTGTVSVRRWWYVDTVTFAQIKANKAQHKICESVKVLMSSEAEVAEAERLQDVANNWIIFFFAWLGLGVLVELVRVQIGNRRERLDRLNAEAERDLEASARTEFWVSYATAKETERQRSKTANEERARRKADRGATLEAKRIANLERKG